MLSEKDLLNILDKKEKVDIEFKEAKRGVPKSIYETYSSFANTNGAEGFQVPELYENQDMRTTNLKLWIVKKEHGALSGA